MGSSSVQKNIVLIDDNFVIREVLRSYLESIETDVSTDFKTYSSDNGIEGLGLVFTANPDLIIIDLTLPKYSGREVLNYLTSNQRYRYKSVIVLHQNEVSKVLPHNFKTINKSDKDFLGKLQDAVTSILASEKKSFRKGFFKSIRFSLARKLLKSANRSDKLMFKHDSSTSLVKKTLTFLPWLLNQLVQSLLYFLFRSITAIKPPEDIKQKKKDQLNFRVRYYPTLLTLSTAILLLVVQVAAFVGGGLVILNTRIDPAYALKANEISFELRQEESDKFRYDSELIEFTEEGAQLKAQAVNSEEEEDGGDQPTPESFPQAALLEEQKLLEQPVTTYPTTRPSIEITQPVTYSNIESIEERSSNTSEQNYLSYQLSPDGSSWYYWSENESRWVRTERGAVSSNKLEVVNNNLDSYVDNLDTGEISVKIFFHSDGLETAVLEELVVSRDNDLTTVVDTELPEEPQAPEETISALNFAELEPHIFNASYVDGEKVVLGKLLLKDPSVKTTYNINEEELSSYEAVITYENGTEIGRADLNLNPRGEIQFLLRTPEADGGFVQAQVINTTNPDQKSAVSPAVENSTFTVDSTADDADSNPGDGLCQTVLAECTLRAAIEESNAVAGADNIHFSIPTSDPGYRDYDLPNTPSSGDSTGGDDYWRIDIGTSALPHITDEVLIEGYTQIGSSKNTVPTPDPLNTRLTIQINQYNSVYALRFGTGSKNSKITGLNINGNSNVIIGSPNVTGIQIQGNFIGTDIMGLDSVSDGVVVNGLRGGSVIGQDSLRLPEDRNLISTNGNAFTIQLMNVSVTSQSRVIGNYIGIDKNGSPFTLENTSHAIRARHQTLVEDNVIGNTALGVSFGSTVGAADGSVVKNNYIGVSPSGLPLPMNTGNIAWAGGILIESANNVEILDNVVANNGNAGVLVSVGAANALIQGNEITSNGTGILVPYADNTSRGRFENNIIQDNYLLEVDIAEDDGTRGTVNINDQGDSDSTRSNDQMNWPLISDVIYLGSNQFEVSGGIDGNPTEAPFDIEICLSSNHPSGHGGCAEPLGVVTTSSTPDYTAGSSNWFRFNGTFTVSGSVTGDEKFSALATNSLGSTSEFGSYTDANPILNDNGTPADTSDDYWAITVNSTSDEDNVSSTGFDDGSGAYSGGGTEGPDGLANGKSSLREAIIVANNFAQPVTIEFDIPTTDPGYRDYDDPDTPSSGDSADGDDYWKIAPQTVLPILSTSIIIDGQSQSENVNNSNGDSPEIEIVGEEISSGYTIGIDIRGDNSGLRNLAVSRFSGENVSIEDIDNVFVRNSYIGLDAKGIEEHHIPADSSTVYRSLQANGSVSRLRIEENYIASGRYSTIQILCSNSDANADNVIANNRIGVNTQGELFNTINKHIAIQYSGDCSGTVIGNHITAKSSWNTTAFSNNSTGLNVINNNFDELNPGTNAPHTYVWSNSLENSEFSGNTFSMADFSRDDNVGGVVFNNGTDINFRNNTVTDSPHYGLQIINDSNNINVTGNAFNNNGQTHIQLHKWGSGGDVSSVLIRNNQLLNLIGGPQSTDTNGHSLPILFRGTDKISPGTFYPTANDIGDVDSGHNQIQNYSEIISVEYLGDGKYRIKGRVDGEPSEAPFTIEICESTEHRNNHGGCLQSLGTTTTTSNLFETTPDGSNYFSWSKVIELPDSDGLDSRTFTSLTTNTNNSTSEFGTNFIASEDNPDFTITDRAIVTLSPKNGVEITDTTPRLNWQEIFDGVAYGPETTASLATGRGSTYDIAVKDDVAFVSNYNRVNAFDITNKYNPVELDKIIANSQSLAIKDDVLFAVASWGGIIYAIDISDPSNLIEIDRDQAGITALVDIIIDGNYAYVRGETDLVVYDISDPTNLQVANYLPIPNPSTVRDSNLAIRGDRLYMNTQDQLVTYDISDPVNPSIIQSISNGQTARSVFTTDADLLYELSLEDMNLQIYRMDTSGLQLLNSIELEKTYSNSVGQALSINGDTMFVSESPGGVYKYDISDELQPELVSAYRGVESERPWHGIYAEDENIVYITAQLSASGGGGPGYFSIIDFQEKELDPDLSSDYYELYLNGDLLNTVNIPITESLSYQLADAESLPLGEHSWQIRGYRENANNEDILLAESDIANFSIVNRPEPEFQEEINTELPAEELENIVVVNTEGLAPESFPEEDAKEKDLNEGQNSLSFIFTSAITPLITALLVATMASLALGPFAQFLERAGIILGIILPRRKKYWGIVFDVNDSKVIPFVIVELRDSTGNLIDRTVTDLEGRYGLNSNLAGLYSLSVKAAGYQMYSREITLSKNEEIIEDVPLVKDNSTQLTAIKQFLYYRKNELFTFTRRIYSFLVILGFIFTVYATIVSPILFNYILLGVYVIMLGLQLIRLARGRKVRTRVLDEAGMPVDRTTVRVYSANKLEDIALSNIYGRIRFRSSKGVKDIYAQRVGYTNYHGKHSVIANGNLNKDIQLRKLAEDGDNNRFTS